MKTLITFSMDEVILSDEQRDAIRSLFAEWVITSTKNGRVLIDALIPGENIAVAEAALTTYTPIIIGTWDFDGNLLSTFNEAEYISMLPPIIKMSGDMENPIVTEIPRTEAVETHRFGGWGERKWA